MSSNAAEGAAPGDPSRSEVLWALEATTDNVVLLDREFRITFINRATAELNGITLDEVRGRSIWEVWPGNVGTEIERNYRKAMAEGVPVRFIHGYFEPGKFDLWLEIHAYPSPDGLAVFFHDVSDVKREAARESDAQERLASAMRASDLGVWRCDLPLNDHPFYWSPQVRRHFGISADEPVGVKEFLELLHPDDRVMTSEAMRRAIEDRVPYDVVYRTLGRDGRLRWIRATGNAFYRDDGTPYRFDGFTVDLTAQVENEQALAFLSRLTEAIMRLRGEGDVILTCERMLGEYLGVSRVSFAVANSEGTHVTVREEWTDGVPSIVGTHSVADYGPDVRADFFAGRVHVSRDAEREYAPEAGLEAVRAVGARSGLSVPIVEDGRLTHLLVIHHREPRDWTEGEIALARQAADRMMTEVERARSEAALRASEERFRAVQEMAPDPFTILEAVRDESGEILDFRWTYVNEATGRLTGETTEELLGALVSERHPGIRDGDLYQAWLHTLETGEPFTRELFMDFPVGRTFLRLTGVRVGDGIATIFTDLTQRRLNEERLERAVSDRTIQLQAAVKEAEGFNYSIAHDLRAPLRAMVSTSSILLEEAGPTLSDEHRALLVRQKKNASRLGRLIDELLRLSRLARAEVKRESLDVTAMVRSVFNDLTEQGRADRCVLDAQEEMKAQGDVGLVRTVLHNLLGNACKFSPDGGTIQVRERGGVLSVADEGVGFDMVFAPKIFLPFERLVTDAEFEGTGIGLANVERIVRRHGGRVWVESEPGRGSTFFITLSPDADGSEAGCASPRTGGMVKTPPTEVNASPPSGA